MALSVVRHIATKMQERPGLPVVVLVGERHATSTDLTLVLGALAQFDGSDNKALKFEMPPGMARANAKVLQRAAPAFAKMVASGVGRLDAPETSRNVRLIDTRGG